LLGFVRRISTCQQHIVIDYRDWLLAGDAESPAAEFMRQDCIINRFQQSWAEGGVDAKGSVHDFFSDLVLGHNGFP
jgi:hypothetical protein